MIASTSAKPSVARRPTRETMPGPSYDDLPSQELADRWGQGDEDAAEALYSRYFDQVARLVKGRLNQKFRARLSSHDVVQSAFRSVFRITRDAPQKFEDDDAFRRWLVTVALNKVFKRIEFEQAKKRSPDREQPTSSSEGFTSYVTECLSAPPQQAAAVAIAELWEKIAEAVPEEQQQLMLLRLEGLSQVEIAERMEVTTRTVRRWSKDLELRAEPLLREELGR